MKTPDIIQDKIQEMGVGSKNRRVVGSSEAMPRSFRKIIGSLVVIGT